MYQFGEGTLANANHATGIYIRETVTDAMQKWMDMRDATSIKEYVAPSDFSASGALPMKRMATVIDGMATRADRERLESREEPAWTTCSSG